MTRAADLAKLIAGGGSITVDDNATTLSLVSTDADANSGPVQVLYRNSSSPADSDLVGEIHFRGRNDNSQDVEYVTISTRMEDVSDGTEDGKIILKTMVNGTARSRIEIDHTDVVINQDSIDSNFRVESNNQAGMIFVDAGNDRVGIGTVSPSVLLDLESTAPVIRLTDSDATGTPECEVSGAGGDITLRADRDGEKDSSLIGFEIDGSEKMRLGDGGNLLIGRTSVGSTGNGHSIRGGDSAIFSRDASGETMQVCRNSDNGELIRFKRNNSTIGHIANIGDAPVFRNVNEDGISVLTDGGQAILVSTNSSGLADNDGDIGRSSNRFDDIHATNGTIQTSDQNEKQDIASATTKELNVAKKLSALFKTFRWKDRVAEKGDKARTHTGIIAQEVQSAFKAEGLDASNYGLFTLGTWWEKDGDRYFTEEEAPSDATKKERLGVRYPELFSFIFSSIEARLTALESK